MTRTEGANEYVDHCDAIVLVVVIVVHNIVNIVVIVVVIVIVAFDDRFFLTNSSNNIYVPKITFGLFDSEKNNEINK